MSVQLRWDGLAEFAEYLRQLPNDLVAEGSDIITTEADITGQEIITNYPERTGNLKRGVSVENTATAPIIRAVIRSRAPHAHLYEYGTKPRKTSRGWFRGRMPVAPQERAMMPKTRRAGFRIMAKLILLIRRDPNFQVAA